jgi:TolA-binding protein
MEFTSLAGNFASIAGYVVGAIGVGFAAIQAYSSGFSATEKAKDQASKELVTILQETVETLKAEMKEMQNNHINNVTAIAQLKGENETLLKILQGRDEKYLKFQQDGFAAFKRVENTEKNIERLVGLLERKLT